MQGIVDLLLVQFECTCTSYANSVPNHRIIKNRSSLFGRVARLGKDTSAHQALQHQIHISLGRLPDRTWKHPPGRPRSKWLNQIRSDNNLLPDDLWRCAIRRGHSGVTQQPQPTIIDNDDDSALRRHLFESHVNLWVTNLYLRL